MSYKGFTLVSSFMTVNDNVKNNGMGRGARFVY